MGADGGSIDRRDFGGVGHLSGVGQFGGVGDFGGVGNFGRVGDLSGVGDDRGKGRELGRRLPRRAGLRCALESVESTQAAGRGVKRWRN